MQHLQKKAMAEPTFQQSALQEYVVDANDVMRFKLVSQEKDMDNEILEFAPEMCHQVNHDAKQVSDFSNRYMGTMRTSLDIGALKSLSS